MYDGSFEKGNLLEGLSYVGNEDHMGAVLSSCNLVSL